MHAEASHSHEYFFSEIEGFKMKLAIGLFSLLHESVK